MALLQIDIPAAGQLKKSSQRHGSIEVIIHRLFEMGLCQVQGVAELPLRRSILSCCPDKSPVQIIDKFLKPLPAGPGLDDQFTAEMEGAAVMRREDEKTQIQGIVLFQKSAQGENISQ